jgi:hypothetical protein
MPTPWTAYPVTDATGVLVHPGDRMRHAQNGTHLRNLRDGYLREGKPSQRAMMKQWYDDALAERFTITEVGHNGHAPGYRYQKVNSTSVGECIYYHMEKVPDGQA